MKAIMTMVGGAMAFYVAFASVDSGALIQDSNPIRSSGSDVTELRESFERGLGISLDEKPEFIRSSGFDATKLRESFERGLGISLDEDPEFIRSSGFDATKLRESFERGLGISLDEKPNPDAAQLEYVDSGSQGSEDLAHVFARGLGFSESQDDRKSLVR